MNAVLLRRQEEPEQTLKMVHSKINKKKPTEQPVGFLCVNINFVVASFQSLWLPLQAGIIITAIRSYQFPVFECFLYSYDPTIQFNFSISVD